MPYQHSFEMCLNLPTAQLELLYYVRYLLETMNVTVRHKSRMSYHEEGGTFKKDDFICAAEGAECIQM